MSAIVKFLKETYAKQSLFEAIKAGGWKAALDGTLFQATVVHGPNATLVGTDAFGNKYYERMTEQYGRHRWVVYGNLDFVSGQDPSTVPPEWHGWLHQITDEHPNKADIRKPIYAIPHLANRTASGAPQQPKGSWWNPQKRNWRKVETWNPSAQ